MRVVVVGAGPIGLATAMLLARVDATVTVLDKDPQPPPDDPWEAWADWERSGVAQFRQPHLALPRVRHLLDAELPDVRDRLEAIGGRRLSPLELLPRSVADRSPRPGDDRFELLTARRPVLEAAFAHVAATTSGVEIRRGVAVAEPIEGRSVLDGVPHVGGVRTKDGEDHPADLVVDAMGRRSPLTAWVTGLGGRPPLEEASDAGFAYYSRHYRSADGRSPEIRGPFGVDLATVRILTLPGDNGAWTVALIPMAGDAPFKALRHTKVWEKVVRAFPHAAHWLDGKPLSDVIPMAGVLDRNRRTIVDGRPVVTGLIAIGDAWACTNPQAGRGLSLGLMHATALRDAVRAHGDDPAALALRLDELTESELTPWYRDQVNRDRQRAADHQAVIDGRPQPPPTPERAAANALFAAVGQDADVARGWFEVFANINLPSEVLSRPEIAEKVARFAGSTPQPMAGPTRAQLLTLLAG
ncbi:MAG TPA: NAD(P)-binding protein [Candidatus Dormibacteraeota bacterium]